LVAPLNQSGAIFYLKGIGDITRYFKAKFHDIVAVVFLAVPLHLGGAGCGLKKIAGVVIGVNALAAGLFLTMSKKAKYADLNQGIEHAGISPSLYLGNPVGY